ncbi:MAG TPA: sulfurtransferase [Solirubrobacterales bacterium]|nr:sulfurtransferase [Solirubrobacterales bacterium]
MNSVSVDAEWVAAHLDDPDVQVIEVDVRSAAYDEGHVPGAVLWDAHKDLRHPDFSPIDKAEFEAVLAGSGLTPDTTVVFYGYAPLLGFWLLDRHGHERMRIMDGPREQWDGGGRSWSTEVPSPESTSYVSDGGHVGLLASTAEVEDAIGDPGTVILDVRSPEEFSGERFWPSGAPEDVGRAGHIPGAVHVPVSVLTDEDGDPADREDLRAIFEKAGVTPDKKVITYCTIGNRASQVAFVLKHDLAYPEVAVYYGSWSHWGHQPDAPVET